MFDNGMPKTPDAHAELRDQARQLRRLHHENRPLVLPNAWDVPSACVFARHPRCRALGTSSAGISAAHGYAEIGYPVGESIPPVEMFDAIARIGRVTRAAGIPLSADLESGYGATPDDVATTIRSALAAGAVGANLEDAGPDGLLEIAHAAERIHAARAAADATGVAMVINARTDVYWRQIGDPADRLDHTIDRLTAYRRAGADCLFAPGVTDPNTIRALVTALDAPLNVLATANTPTVAELRDLGVARLSVGSGPIRAALTHTRHLAAELFDYGTYTTIGQALPYTELAELLRI